MSVCSAQLPCSSLYSALTLNSPPLFPKFPFFSSFLLPHCLFLLVISSSSFSSCLSSLLSPLYLLFMLFPNPPVSFILLFFPPPPFISFSLQELKQQNDLMVETKALLEQKAISLTARAESVDELQEELASIKVQLESLNQVNRCSSLVWKALWYLLLKLR